MKYISLILCCSLMLSILNAQSLKVEPPFWWADMHETELQLMIYGPDVANSTISFSPNITVLQVRKTENPNYQFVTIDTKNLAPQTIRITVTSPTDATTTYDYELKQRRDGSRERKGFTSADAIYLIMPDRFANGNPTNDSTDDTAEKVNRKNKGGRHGGDIQGIIDHLDYLKDLGMTAIWSTPLLEDNEPVYSYHTYAQSDLYKIDPRYGSNADYKRLATEMHNRDMKLIMDYVTNHWGSKHWMIQDLPTKDWIHIWPDGDKGFRRSNYRMTTQFDSNASDIDTEGCMNGWFDTTMPDMNQQNPLLLKYIIQNAKWWIEYADLDGFRVDTYSYNDKEAISQWTKAIMDEYPNFNIMGEVWMHNQAQIAYWQKDSPIGAIQSFNSHLPTVMDFTLHDAFLTVFNEDSTTMNKWFDGMVKVYENFTNDFLYPDINNLLVFMGNHDTNRINEIFKGSIKKYQLALTLLTTCRGIPQFYYGDEIGMKGNRDKRGDGDIRRDFPGGWPGDKSNAFEASGRSVKQQKYFDLTKRLFNWRKGKSVIHTGKTKQYIPFDNVYVYFRYDDTDSVMVIINNNPKRQELDLSRFAESLKNKTQGVDVISQKNITLGDKLSITGNSSMIIELN